LAVAVQKPVLHAGRYDSGLRRQSTRKGRETGCSIYIPAEELLKAGIDPHGPPPLYRTWGTKRGGVMVQLYKPEPTTKGDE
jgi:hypothetical protein